MGWLLLVVVLDSATWVLLPSVVLGSAGPWAMALPLLRFWVPL
jgi:hypothetical protein